jgi:1-acyl-sn-glycerol-3-phosphate acyltransferase
MFIGFFKTIYTFYRTFFFYLNSSDDLEKNNLLKKKWALETLNRLGFDLKVNGIPLDHEKLILVGNHISYLDIIVLFAVAPNSVFLAKSEVSRWPIIGPAARKIGTIFVQRESKESRGKSKMKVEELLLRPNAQTQIAVFPSGTTTLREEKIWKKGLFEIAKSTNTRIQPFKIHYSHPRECAYIDDDQLFTSLMKLFSIAHKNIHFTWGKSYLPQNIESEIEETRQWTQNNTESDSFRPSVTNSSVRFNIL